MIKSILIFITLFFNVSFGQTYNQLIQQADSLYNVKDLKKSNEMYQKAFLLNQKNAYDIYKAACHAASEEDAENSVKFLNLAVKNRWLDIEEFRAIGDLNNLHNNAHWQSLIENLQNKIDSSDSGSNKTLQKQLLKVRRDDQEPRYQQNVLIEKYGYNNPKVDSITKVMEYKDRANIEQISRVIDANGWVGKNEVGIIANQTIFLVIQHANLKTQEKYLPIMHEVVKKGNASNRDLALLEDRVALREGKKQIYGTQPFFNKETHKLCIAPLEDPDNVDKRRAEIGLPPMAEAVKQFNIIWNVEEYKKLLPFYEKLQQEMMNKK